MADKKNNGAPTSVDPWITKEIMARVTYNELSKKLDKKVDKEVIELKLEILENETKAAERIFEKTQAKISSVPKTGDMVDLRNIVTGWSNWFRRSVVGAILFIIVTGFGAVYQYSTLNSTVNTTHLAIRELTVKIKEIKEFQRSQQNDINDIQRVQQRIKETQTFLDRKFEIISIQGIKKKGVRNENGTRKHDRPQ